MSVHMQQTQNHQTYLLGAEDYVQTKQMGLRAAQARREYAYTCRAIGDSSNRPANVLVTLVLPANGAEPCTGKPKRPRDQTDASDTRTCTQSVVSNSNIPANTSVITATLNSPAGGTEPHTGGAKKARKPIGHVKHLHTHAEGCKEPCKHAEHVQASAWRHERLENT